jgi:hypothetical protein
MDSVALLTSAEDGQDGEDDDDDDDEDQNGEAEGEAEAEAGTVAEHQTLSLVVYRRHKPAMFKFKICC